MSHYPQAKRKELLLASLSEYSKCERNIFKRVLFLLNQYKLEKEKTKSYV
jgi:hypothetical protein